MRIRLDIAYDGGLFRGWARQPGLRTVQGVLETALARILGGEPRLVVAGRTDAGVHASGQVAHLDLDAAQQRRLRDRRACAAASDDEHAQALAARIAGALGAYPDVAVTASARAPEGFDARFSPLWRRYTYRIADRRTGYDPRERARTTTVRSLLDVDLMRAAARELIGLHDFAAFCKQREGATTIRTLIDFDWQRDERGVVCGHVRADAFCHSMVRALVGGCVAAGEGRLAPAELATILRARRRVPEVKVLAARGLTLVEVGYPDPELLAARAEQTRARRDAQ
ncbi:MAG: tRNA pseudouridine(38-40) synthase TruA [Leucobacter sp.]